MNNDLISRKELRKAFKKLPFFTGAYLYYARQLIDNAPPIEINTNDIEYKAYCKGLEDGKKIAIPHGKWLFKEVTDDHKVYGQCSVCKLRKRIDNYCPYCGAKMDGEEAGGVDCMDEDAKQASIPYTYNAPQHDWKCGYPDIIRGEEK